MNEEIKITESMPFGYLVQKARMAARLMSPDVYHRAGLGRSYYSRIESGGRLAKAWESVRRVIVGGGLPLEHFFPHDMIAEAADRIRPGAKNDGAPADPK